MRITHVSTLALALAMIVTSAQASQTDIIGPPESGAFGHRITVLPNGNIVVIDRTWNDVGAAYLYSPSGVLISTLTGSSDNDLVGSNGAVVLADGNYVILSPYWDNGPIDRAGAVTWADADTGVSGVVSAANSLVGTSPDDKIGSFYGIYEGDLLSVAPGVTALANGNYVVRSTSVDNGAIVDVGAITLADGMIGLSGPVSVANSLFGASAEDRIGTNVVELENGNFLSISTTWSNGSAANAGAVTWVSGTTGLTGVVSSANSLVGSHADDELGMTITLLANGNYVVISHNWDNDTILDVGAATWGNGITGLNGTVTSSNSLIGTTTDDRIGYAGATALTNGNYVVLSPFWNNGAIAFAGAATWVDGNTGLIGVVSAGNSLVGTSPHDSIGRQAVALANSNYVVGSHEWDNAGAGATNVGAATWADGSIGITGAVSPSNSLVGSTSGDSVSFGSNITALANGNYVVGSEFWNNGVDANVGAATWADGDVGLVGQVTTANSLIGSSPGDRIASSGILALKNGNYVVGSKDWDNGSIDKAGAATWADGNVGLVGSVSPANSLVGAQAEDHVGSQLTALANDHYVIASASWSFGGLADSGAVTWGDGSSGITGEATIGNSLLGAQDTGLIGSGGVTAFDDGNYVVSSPAYNNGSILLAGALTLSRGDPGVSGLLNLDNTVLGTSGESPMPFDYDEIHEQLVVGRPDDNIVTLLTLPLPDALFANGFDSPEVVTGAINLPVANDFNGSALDLVTGSYLPHDENHEVDINLYNRTGGLRAYWYANLEPDFGGVSTDGVSYDVLDSGDVIGAQSPVIRSQDGLEAHWWGGADGYLGIAFLNEETGATNYGYIHLTTSAPNGYPAQVLEYAYNNAGNAITIP